MKVERNGEIYSFTGVQYKATLPDGRSFTFWSPPWSDDESDQEKDDKAREYALKVAADEFGWKDGGEHETADSGTV